MATTSRFDAFLPIPPPIPQGDGSRAMLPLRWTAAHAALRLTEAWETARMMRGGGGPAGAKGFWPETVHTQVDLAWQRDLTPDEKSKRAKEKNHVRLMPTSSQIAMLDRANGWLLDYVHAGHSVQVLTGYADHVARGNEAKFWPEADFAKFAEFLNSIKTAVI